MPYVRLDCGLLDSSLWIEPGPRELFITALLMAHPHVTDVPVAELDPHATTETGFTVPAGWYGLVEAAGVAIVRRALMDPMIGAAALIALASPDASSRSPEFEGRRMIRVAGGYLILNYDKYRERDYSSSERSRRYRERKQAARNKRRHAVASRSNAVASRSHGVACSDITQAEAEAITTGTTIDTSAVSDTSSPSFMLEGSQNARQPPAKATKVCPDDWRPSERLLQRVSEEGVGETLTRGGTTVLMELERMRATTFRTARSDWDRVFWGWLLTECKNINQKEALYGSRQQARR